MYYENDIPFNNFFKFSKPQEKNMIIKYHNIFFPGVLYLKYIESVNNRKSLCY